MKAIFVKEPGGPEILRPTELPAPEPGPGQIQLAVRATALNRADLLQRRGLYPPPPGETNILGLECSGRVSALGPGVEDIGCGERVMALLPGGGYAEHVVIDRRMAIPIPEGMSFEDAAAIPEAFLTAREALFTLGGTTPGSSVLVHAAAGGVGSAAVQLAHRAGAHVVATAGSAEKLTQVRSWGADTTVDYKTQDFVELAREATEGSGVDVILDFVGGAYWEKHARALAIGGRCVVIGVMGGAKAEVNLGLLLMKRHQILGLVMRSRPLVDKIAITQSFIRESLPLFNDGRLKPIVDSVFEFDAAPEAHQRMESNSNIGKIVLRIGRD